MKRKFFISLLLIVSAIFFFKPVFSQNKNDYYHKANNMLVAGDFGKAEELYNVAIQQNPKFSEAYIGLGMAYKEMGKFQEAYEATYKAIKLNPSYYQAYYNLGIILEKMNRNDEAINSYEKFLKEVPGAERFSDAKQRIVRLKEAK